MSRTSCAWFFRDPEVAEGIVCHIGKSDSFNMPVIPLGAQIFDLAFHPTHSTVYTALITGDIKAFQYDEQAQCEPTFDLRPSKRSCRGLASSIDGRRLWAVGKEKALLYVEFRFLIYSSPLNL